MANEKMVTYTSLQYIISEATAFGGICFTAISMITGYLSSSVNSRELATFALMSYLLGIPFALSLRFFVIPIVNRKT